MTKEHYIKCYKAGDFWRLMYDYYLEVNKKRVMEYEEFESMVNMMCMMSGRSVSDLAGYICKGLEKQLGVIKVFDNGNLIGLA